MSMTPYLTDEEIKFITDPLTQGAARIRFFERLGLKVAERPNGQPLVWRSDYEAVAPTVRASRAKRPAPGENIVRPDFEALRAKKRRVMVG